MLAGTELEKAQCGTIAAEVVQVGAQIRVSVRKVWSSLSGNYASADLFTSVITQLERGCVSSQPATLPISKYQPEWNAHGKPAPILSPLPLPTGSPAAGEAMHIVGFPNYSAREPNYPLFSAISPLPLGGAYGRLIDEKSGLAGKIP